MTKPHKQQVNLGFDFLFSFFTFPLIKVSTKSYFLTPTYLAKYIKLKYITSIKSIMTDLNVIHVFAKYVFFIISV